MTLRTFVCGNCGKDFALSEQTKLHWLLHVGAVIITWGLWWPPNLCSGCQAKVSLVGAIGLLLSSLAIIAVLFKVLGRGLV